MAKQKIKIPRRIAVVGRDGVSAADLSDPAPRRGKSKAGVSKAKLAATKKAALPKSVARPKRTAKVKTKSARKKADLAGPAAGAVALATSAPSAPGPVANRLKPKFPAKAGIGRLERLEIAVRDVKLGARSSPRTRRLIVSGIPKMAQKLIEEAAEAGIEAVRGDRLLFVQESVDLLYNFVVLCAEMGVPIADIWSEMDRRELTLGMAEKMPKVADPNG